MVRFDETVINWIEHKDRPTPIFGMSVNDMMPALREIIGGMPMLSLQIDVRHGFGACDGGSGKMVARFIWRSIIGETHSVTTMVKRMHRPDTREIRHYRSLMALEAPVPKLLGATFGMNGEEILFIEHPDRIDEYDAPNLEGRSDTGDIAHR